MPRSTNKSQTTKSTGKKTTKVEPVELEPVEVEVEEVEEVEEATEPESSEVELSAEETEVADKKKSKKSNKSKKVEYNNENLDESIAEFTDVSEKLKDLLKYHEAVRKNTFKLVEKLQKQLKKRKPNTTDSLKEKTGFRKDITVPSKFVEFYEANLKDDEGFALKYPDFDINAVHARTFITGVIYYYIKTNQLYEKDEAGNFKKRNIAPDEVLIKLFDIKENEEIRFNNFQSYVTRLYNFDASDVEEVNDADIDADVEVEESEIEVEEVAPEPEKQTISKTKQNKTTNKTLVK